MNDLNVMFPMGLAWMLCRSIFSGKGLRDVLDLGDERAERRD